MERLVKQTNKQTPPNKQTNKPWDYIDVTANSIPAQTVHKVSAVFTVTKMTARTLAEVISSTYKERVGYGHITCAERTAISQDLKRWGLRKKRLDTPEIIRAKLTNLTTFSTVVDTLNFVTVCLSLVVHTATITIYFIGFSIVLSGRP